MKRQNLLTTDLYEKIVSSELGEPRSWLHADREMITKEILKQGSTKLDGLLGSLWQSNEIQDLFVEKIHPSVQVFNLQVYLWKCLEPELSKELEEYKLSNVE